MNKKRQQPTIVAAILILAMGYFAPPLLAASEDGAVLGTGEIDPAAACPEGICGGLGNSFYVPSLNALGLATGGFEIFKDRKLGTCAKQASSSHASRAFRFVTSTENFYTAASAETQIEGSYDSKKLSFSGSLEASTGYTASKKESVQALTLDVTFRNGVVDFVRDTRCLAESNLEEGFLAAFRALPMIHEYLLVPEQSWVPYVAFLKTWGSHVMVQQTLGSRFQQWESVLQSQAVSQKTLQAKACAEVEGTGEKDAGWSVNGCAAYSEEEKRNAQRTETKQSRLIIGGTDATRKALLKEASPKTLNAFIDVADKADQAIEHQWMPIWNVLNRVVKPCQEGEDCSDFQRVVNLEAAYEGWVAVGCPSVTSKDNHLQRMVRFPVVKSAFYTYACFARKEGCIESEDCHLGGAGSVCYCYGGGCIVRDKDEPIGNPMDPIHWRNTIRVDQEGSYDEGVNKTCTYRFGAYCGCNPDDVVGEPHRLLWNQAVSSGIESLATPSRFEPTSDLH